MIIGPYMIRSQWNNPPDGATIFRTKQQ